MATNARTNLLTATALERSLGRLIRSPEGHPDAPNVQEDPPTPGNTVEIAVTPAPVAVEKKPEAAPVTAEDLEAEFGGGDAPAVDAPAAEPAAGGEEPAATGDDPPVQAKTAEDRIAELLAENRELRRAAQPPEPEAPAADTALPQEESEPDPDNYEFGDADAKYIADFAAHHARKAVREEMAAQQEQTRFDNLAKERQAKFDTAVQVGSEKYSDFKAKVVDGADNGDWPCSPFMAIAMVENPVGFEVAYHLASNVEEAKRISDLAPASQLIEMGMLMGRFGSSATQQPPEQRRTTAAPPPPTNRARGEGGQYATPLDSDDFAAVEKRFDAMMAGKR